MKKQPYALEEKLLWYPVRTIKSDIFEETEELIKITRTNKNICYCTYFFDLVFSFV